MEQKSKKQQEIEKNFQKIFIKTYDLNREKLQKFLQEKKLKLIEKISKGYSSEVYLVQEKKESLGKRKKKGERAEGKNGKEGKRFALKIEKEKSPRKDMAEKEVANLKKANSVGIGPCLHDWDFEKRIILMEFIKGKTFVEWLFEEDDVKKEKNEKKKERKKKELQKLLNSLFKQAEKLDEIGLDHGQLAGKGANILVQRNKPVIIDFEKASQNRKCHNVTQLESMLYRNPHGEISRRVKEILEKHSN